MKYSSYAASSQNDISGAIKCVLHGAADWEGGRKDRFAKEEGTNCENTQQEIAECPKTSGAEEVLGVEQKEMERVNCKE